MGPGDGVLREISLEGAHDKNQTEAASAAVAGKRPSGNGGNVRIVVHEFLAACRVG